MGMVCGFDGYVYDGLVEYFGIVFIDQGGDVFGFGVLVGCVEYEGVVCVQQVGFVYQVLQVVGIEDYMGGGIGIGKIVVGRQEYGRIRCVED